MVLRLPSRMGGVDKRGCGGRLGPIHNAEGWWSLQKAGWAMNKILLGIQRRYICHLAAALFAALVVAPLSIMAFDRTPAFKLADGFTIPGILEPGKPYRFNWRWTDLRSGDCDGTVRWRIIDSEGTIWASEAQRSLFSNIDLQDGVRIVGRERTLPSGIAEGPIEMHAEVVFICNWLHNWWPMRSTFPVIRSTVKYNGSKKER